MVALGVEDLAGIATHPTAAPMEARVVSWVAVVEVAVTTPAAAAEAMAVGAAVTATTTVALEATVVAVAPATWPLNGDEGGTYDA